MFLRAPRGAGAAFLMVVGFARQVGAQEIAITGPLCGPDQYPCVSKEEERAARAAREETKEVAVRAKLPPRSASDWEIDREQLRSLPKADGAAVMAAAPGLHVSERSLLGRAPRLSLRGFDATAGQDMEIFLGNIPLNQVSNIRAPGYADMRLVIPEAVRGVRTSNGPYDPRQGDFAIAGSTHLDLGLPAPGFWGKGTLGSFGSRRLFLGFAPAESEWQQSVAAFETFSTDGPGEGRAGERSSFVGQLSNQSSRQGFRAIAALGSARFDFPGYLRQDDVERGVYPYRPRASLGRDRTQQGLVGLEMSWRAEHGSFVLDVFAAKSKTSMHQNLTGYVLDLRGGRPPTNDDDGEQVNEASTVGLHTAYRRGLKILSKRDMLELGVYARLDTVDQTDTRLLPDGTKNIVLTDATVNATNLAAYVDAALYPVRRVVIRGGTRFDSLSYAVTDRTGNIGLERTAQGVHLGNKATVDVATGNNVHMLASYGEGFRSPQARELAEGERLPFATVRSAEFGPRYRDGQRLQASLVGFGSWLSEDRVFDALARENASAPPSSRVGGALTATARTGHLGAHTSATYADARFTGTRGAYREGDSVPYAPRLVMRSEAFYTTELGKVSKEPMIGRIGAGFEAAAFRVLPDGAIGRNVFYVDAQASLAWRELELGVSGLNVLNHRYYEAQYVYVTNFERSAVLPAPTRQVLVGPPASIFVTLSVHLAGKDTDRDDSD